MEIQNLGRKAMRRQLQIIILLMIVTLVAACGINNNDTESIENNASAQEVENDTNNLNDENKEVSEKSKEPTNDKDILTEKTGEKQSNKNLSGMKVHFIDVGQADAALIQYDDRAIDRKSTRLNSSHVAISYAVFCLKKKKKTDAVA